MKPNVPYLYDKQDASVMDADEVKKVPDDDLWFLPGRMEDEPDDLPPGATGRAT
jgi:hypothetical protein